MQDSTDVMILIIKPLMKFQIQWHSGNYNFRSLIMFRGSVHPPKSPNPVNLVKILSHAIICTTVMCSNNFDKNIFNTGNWILCWHNMIPKGHAKKLRLQDGIHVLTSWHWGGGLFWIILDLFNHTGLYNKIMKNTVVGRANHHEEDTVLPITTVEEGSKCQGIHDAYRAGRLKEMDAFLVLWAV